MRRFFFHPDEHGESSSSAAAGGPAMEMSGNCGASESRTSINSQMSIHSVPVLRELGFGGGNGAGGGSPDIGAGVGPSSRLGNATQQPAILLPPARATGSGSMRSGRTSPTTSFGLGPVASSPNRRITTNTIPQVPLVGALVPPIFDDEERANQDQQNQHHAVSWSCIIWALIAFIALGIGLGVGLGVGLHHGGNDSNPSIHGQVNGTKKGSGAVMIDFELVLNDKTRITAYFQRFDGIIELNEYFNNSWSNGPNSGDLNTTSSGFNGENFAARDGTPLMAVAYVNLAGELIWHVIYITEDNFLSDWWTTNVTAGKWRQGALRSQDFETSTSNHTGLTACMNKQWYGAPFNSSGLGIRLYYGDKDNVIQELGWNLGKTDWFKISSFPDGNGAAGFECVVRGSSITYLWMQNRKGELQQMWYEFNKSQETFSHPALAWQTGLTWPNMLPNSAISAINDITSTPNTKHVLIQSDDLSIIELISNGTAELDAWSSSYIVGEAEKGVNGTRIACVILDTSINRAQEIHVILQTNDTNTVDFVRPLTSVNWARKVVPVGLGG